VRGVAIFTGDNTPQGAQENDLWFRPGGIAQLVDNDWELRAVLPPYRWIDLAEAPGTGMLDAGAPDTTTWDTEVDGGAANTTVFDAELDGGTL